MDREVKVHFVFNYQMFTSVNKWRFRETCFLYLIIISSSQCRVALVLYSLPSRISKGECSEFLQLEVITLVGQRTEMYGALFQDSDIKINQKPKNRVDVSSFFAMTGLSSSSDFRKMLKITHLPDDVQNILSLSVIHLSIPTVEMFSLLDC